MTLFNIREEQITVNKHLGVVFEGLQIKIYVNDVTSMKYGVKFKQQILENQKIVGTLQGKGLSFLKQTLSKDDFKFFKILFDEKSMKILEYLAEEKHD